MKIRVWRRRMTRRDTGFVKSVGRLMDLMAYHSNKLSKQLKDIYENSIKMKEQE